MKPVRIQLSRQKGFNLQAVSMALNGLPAVNVARPSRWGNPWPIGKPGPDGDIMPTAELACARYAMFIGIDSDMPTKEQIIKELRGKNLACWCPLSTPHCHAEILLQICNSEEPVKPKKASAKI